VADAAKLRVVEQARGDETTAPTGFEARPVGRESNRIRIIDATLLCLALHGTSKTTVDDIASRADLSRATVYRVFPGGRDEVLRAVVDTEIARLFSSLGVRLGEATDLGDALVGGIVDASRRLRGHPALSYVVEHEPETVLGHLAFDESDHLLAVASGFTAPFLARWMRPAEAERVAESAVRIVLSYAISPSASTDLCDVDHTKRLVSMFVLPGIRALHDSEATGAIDITPFVRVDPDLDELTAGQNGEARWRRSRTPEPSVTEDRARQDARRGEAHDD
jgi:AcrR family transcriptional regulator